MFCGFLKIVYSTDKSICFRMMTASNLLYNFHQFVSGIICLAIVATFFGFAGGGPLAAKDRGISIVLLIFIAGTTALTWYLRQQGRHVAVVVILSVIWIAILAGTLYAISKARWN